MRGYVRIESTRKSGYVQVSHHDYELRLIAPDASWAVAIPHIAKQRLSINLPGKCLYAALQGGAIGLEY